MHHIHVDGLPENDSRVRTLNEFMGAFQLEPSQDGIDTKVNLGWFLNYAGVVPSQRDGEDAIYGGRVTIDGHESRDRYLSTGWLANKDIECDGKHVLYGSCHQEGVNGGVSS